MAENATMTKRISESNSPENTRGGYFITPRVDIYESDQELTLVAEVPGVHPDDIDLRYERGELHLLARVQPPQAPQHLLLREYETADFYRALNIHEDIDSARISAECKAGMLTVHLPKAPSAVPRQVRVSFE